VVNSLEAPDILVAGKYRLTRLLGRGGMGTVWEGVHTSLGTRVAVKFIESEHLESAEARNRFENEARAAATLRSKHVVEVYDHGVAPDGRPFIVMEYLQGEPLDRRLDRFGRLPPRDVARILQQVCRALGKAHAAGIIHRDLKPENIFLVWDDEDAADIAKLVDFGIAKFTDQSLGPSSATRTGSVLGTPYYMSPEQARGLRSVDHRADLWSLGVIAYRCIVGKLPFEGEAIGDLLVKICTAPLVLPSQVAADVPSGFDAFIARALSREPIDRFQSTQDFAESLAVVCGLSVRGMYGSGDVPANSGVAQLGRHSGPTIQVPDNVTGAPFTQTPAPRSPIHRGAGKAVAALAASIVLVLIGVVVFANPFASTSDVAPGPAAGGTIAPTPQPSKDDRASLQTAEKPTVVPDAPVAAPSPEVPPPAVKEEARPEVRAEPRRGPTRPRGGQRGAAERTPAPTPPPAAPPVAQPAQQPPAATRPATGKREIDVGY
jgi:serine/threonine-protein kinase